MHTSLEALTSFDRINLGSTLLQAVVALSFAAAQHGVARHFERPAMRALATLWGLLAIAAIVKRAREMPQDAVILANLCGRGDKDIFTVAEALGVEM